MPTLIHPRRRFLANTSSWRHGDATATVAVAPPQDGTAGAIAALSTEGDVEAVVAPPPPQINGDTAVALALSAKGNSAAVETWSRQGIAGAGIVPSANGGAEVILDEATAGRRLHGDGVEVPPGAATGGTSLHSAVAGAPRVGVSLSTPAS